MEVAPVVVEVAPVVVEVAPVEYLVAVAPAEYLVAVAPAEYLVAVAPAEYLVVQLACQPLPHACQPLPQDLKELMNHYLLKQNWYMRLVLAVLAVWVMAGEQTMAQIALAPNNGYLRYLVRMRLPINNPEVLQNATAAGFNAGTHHTGYMIISTRVATAPLRRPNSPPVVYPPKTKYYIKQTAKTVSPVAGTTSGTSGNIQINIGTTNTYGSYTPYNFTVTSYSNSLATNTFSGGTNIAPGNFRTVPYSPFQSFVTPIASGGGGGGTPGGGGGVPGPRMPAPSPRP